MSEPTSTGYSGRSPTETPSSTDKSSSSITPVLRKTRTKLMDPTVFASPESPLFTREDQIKTHKQKTELEMEVATLNQRLTTLKFEAKKVKENMVSNGDLTILKAQTRANMSTSNNTKIKDIMNLFAETMSDVAAASATCSILEQLIAEETKRREDVVDEFSRVAEVLELDDYAIKVPKLTIQPEKPSSVTEINMNRDRQRLKELRNEMMSVESIGRIKANEPEAALEMARSAESQWHLRSVGTLSLRNELQRLQRYCAEGDSMIRKISSAKDEESEKLSELTVRLRQEEVDAEAKVTEATKEFNRQMSELEREFNEMKQSVNSSATRYDKIIREIQNLEAMERERFAVSEDEDEEEEEYELSEDDPDAMIDVAEMQRLMKEKAALQKEVTDLEAKLRHAKKNAKKKESHMLSAIKALNSRYHSLRDEKYQRQTMHSIDDDSGPLQKDIESLLSKIDTSITELRSDLSK